MQIEKVCQICGKVFYVPHWRKNAKFCSTECQHKSLHGIDNATCTFCGKKFHIKKSQIDRYERKCGLFCSRRCFAEYRKIWFVGENNHQYGLKGHLNSSFKGKELEHPNHKIIDTMVYCPTHPYADKNGRIARHRFVVEQNSNMFNEDFFEIVNGDKILKRGLVVHHKDGNHSNDEITNLEILTRGQHTSYHNKDNPMPRDNANGRFIKRIVIWKTQS